MATLSTRRPPVFNVPNQLTLARFLLSLVLFYLITESRWLASFIVFALASFTDWLDGYLARKQGLASTLGRNLDPLVDKILICGAYIFLLPFGMKGDGWLAPWMVTVIVARELVITSLRSFMETRGASFGADWLGKLKMGLQCAALLVVFTALWMRAPDGGEGIFPANLVAFFEQARDGLIWGMLAATMLSGLQYLYRAAAALKTEPES